MSPVTPVTSILPLVFVISVTAVKQAYEDYVRHQADRSVNEQTAHVLHSDGAVRPSLFQDLVLGDIVRVDNGEEFPCDLILLSSALPTGDCFVTTANLDGETSLKLFHSPRATASLDPARLARTAVLARVAPPSVDLNRFTGTLITSVQPGGTPPPSSGLELPPGSSPINSPDTREEPLGTKQLLLKGARLQSTPFIYGLAVYIGRDTKVVMNQRPVPSKFSSCDQRLNLFLAILFFVLAAGCIVSTVLEEEYQDISAKFPYIAYSNDRTLSQWPWLGQMLKNFLTFLILYNYVIPISLYVTLEMQKFLGALFIGWDRELYDPCINEPAQARCSDLNEELGQVAHIFADKTGTLTENTMVFRRCSINGATYMLREKTFHMIPSRSL